jgi:hypothetical protein
LGILRGFGFEISILSKRTNRWKLVEYVHCAAPWIWLASKLAR